MLNFNRQFVCCMIALNLSTAAVAQETATQEIEKSSLGDTKNVHRAGDLFFGGQFNAADIETIKGAGVQRVITLRTDGEIDWDEKAAIEAAGMKFIQLPIRAPESFTDEVFGRVRELLSHSSTKTLFHCGSANRVAGTWLPYRVLDQGVDLETALAEAAEIGLRTPFIKEKAIAYIKRAPKSNTSEGETSVKPGINDQFKDPDLDVDQMIKRFELESREIYFAREAIVEACDIKPGSTVADVGSGTGVFT